ncbi:hypothetical protein EDC01DRAFT_524929 [Geopyxis carbonaria]|nr:hypothetical protein EDC01DRAFT_524929 [Geopyxis carbonaria]
MSSIILFVLLFSFSTCVLGHDHALISNLSACSHHLSSSSRFYRSSVISSKISSSLSVDSVATESCGLEFYSTVRLVQVHLVQTQCYGSGSSLHKKVAVVLPDTSLSIAVLINYFSVSAPDSRQSNYLGTCSFVY